ncbi:MAG: hypothetical protein O2923_08135 [Verrucomicrobia bacterium]|nr:hypothetical protein [Verrucomicrobiota bacterium]MDA1088510.1 hypothetical protein [Verrucomicrobiota bacterium]
MNLRVDLIYPAEQRSASAFNLRSMTRVSVFGVPAILVLIAIVTLVRVHGLSREVRRWENRWRIAAPEKDGAIEFQSTVQRNMKWTGEIESWRSTRAALPTLLSNIRSNVPSMIQFTDLLIVEEFRDVEDEGIMRQYMMTINGKADGSRAQYDVTDLTEALMGKPAFTGLIAKAEVPTGAFGQDTDDPNAPATRRVFQIKAEFKPVPFDQTLEP